MPLYFIENRGQLGPHTGYYVRGHDRGISFGAHGLTLVLIGRGSSNSTARRPEGGAPVRPVSLAREPAAPVPTKRWAVAVEFAGANSAVKPVGEQPTSAVISYFKGSSPEWKTGLPTYARLAYREIWPGVDLLYEGGLHRIKYSFVVKPGADPGRIRLAYHGASDVRTDHGGRLVISTPLGSFQDARPYAYQEFAGHRVEVAAAHSVTAGAVSGTFVHSLRLGAYDVTRPLIIDPEVLIYAGYIGGAADDLGTAIAVDGEGNAYVTGRTQSADDTFPVAVGPSLTYGTHTDAFVAKVSADGTELIYAGYIGGDDFDAGSGIAVDGAGNAYIVGTTSSSEETFPVVAGPGLVFQGAGNDPELGIARTDAFVAKVSADGTRLIYAGYIGGTDYDEGAAIAVDRSGNAYVTGSTRSNEATFPVRGGPSLTHSGGQDAFVAKVTPAGSRLVYAGYIGGSHDDFGFGIAVDAFKHAYVTGRTSSTEESFPAKKGPRLDHRGGEDAFVAKLRVDGTGLIYAGYIGGDRNDSGNGVAVDRDGAAYVVGTTRSTGETFPVTLGPDLEHNGDTDAFVAKVRPDGTALVYAGYIGGDEADGGAGIAVDHAGAAHVTGTTRSGADTFPLRGGLDHTHNGGADAFVAKVRPDGTALAYAGYIGGDADDSGSGVAVDGAGAVYVTGHTRSGEATFPVTVGPDLTYNSEISQYDAFVAKIAFLLPRLDIRPGTVLNFVNPKSQGLLPVAILTDVGFNAASVDPKSVRFGATGAEAAPVRVLLRDVDGDRDLDLLLGFRVPDTRITCGMTSASLTGRTRSGPAIDGGGTDTGGIHIEGSDRITTVGCR